MQYEINFFQLGQSHNFLLQEKNIGPNMRLFFMFTEIRSKLYISGLSDESIP